MHIKWTRELCLAEADKYKTRFEWAEKAHNSYKAAKRNGWFDDCVINKPNKNKEPTRENHNRIYIRKWTEEACRIEGLKYKSRSEWMRNSPSSYKSARLFGYYEECASHLPKYKKIKL